MEKRILTETEETAYRFCHQDFEGLSKVNAAHAMNISVRRVQQLLASVEHKCPSLSHVLPPQQAKVQSLINDQGCTHEQIAIILEISESAVASTVQALRDKGVFLEKRKKTVRYEDHLDSQVKERF